jgi:hypothetical protein
MIDRKNRHVAEANNFQFKAGGNEASIQIVGLKEFRRNLARLGDNAKDDLKAVHLEAAQLVEKAAAPFVPRKTGRLASSLRSSGTLAGARVKIGFKRIPYAGVIHFGWPAHKIKARPFIYDALARQTNNVIELYDTRIEELIRKYDLG